MHLPETGLFGVEMPPPLAQEPDFLFRVLLADLPGKVAINIRGLCQVKVGQAIRRQNTLQPCSAQRAQVASLQWANARSRRRR